MGEGEEASEATPQKQPHPVRVPCRLGGDGPALTHPCSMCSFYRDEGEIDLIFRSNRLTCCGLGTCMSDFMGKGGAGLDANLPAAAPR